MLFKTINRVLLFSQSAVGPRDQGGASGCVKISLTRVPSQFLPVGRAAVECVLSLLSRLAGRSNTYILRMDPPGDQPVPDESLPTASSRIISPPPPEIPMGLDAPLASTHSSFSTTTQLPTVQRYSDRPRAAGQARTAYIRRAKTRGDLRLVGIISAK